MLGGIAIGGGVGLALGIALLIWALTERGKRAKAEHRVVELTQSNAQLRRNIETLIRSSESKDRKIKMADNQVEHLRKSLVSVRDMLASNRDPREARKWLDALGREMGDI